MRPNNYFLLIISSLTLFVGCQKKNNDLNICFSFNYGIDSINTYDSSLYIRDFEKLNRYDFILSTKEKQKIYSKIKEYNLLRIPNDYQENESIPTTTPERRYYLKFSLNGVEKKFSIKGRLYSTENSYDIYGFCMFLEKFLNTKKDEMKIPDSNVIIE